VRTFVARWWARIRGCRYGEHIQTATGRSFWPLDPRPDDFVLADIARGLANTCRYAGQIGMGTGYQFYSVAEHSVIVSCYAERLAAERGLDRTVQLRWALEGLLHDASEAYIADIARPLKHSREMRGYGRIEARVERAIEKAFGLSPSPTSRAAVKSIDNRVLLDEMAAFMHGEDVDAIERRFGPPLGAEIAGLAPEHAESVFLARYSAICVELGQLRAAPVGRWRTSAPAGGLAEFELDLK
jgi:hypothetical protein